MLFIGNGFDLSLGYQTGYSDFYKKSKLLRQYAYNGNELCKHIIANITGELWKDLECGLYKYSLAITKQFGVGNTKAAATFQKEFNELRYALFHYLTNELNESVEAGGLVTCLMTEWNRLNFQCVTFNYTTSIAININGGDGRKCFNFDDSINTDILIYRHGSLYNPKMTCYNKPEDIVLGIDDTQKVENIHSFLYKTQQAVQYQMCDLVNDINEKDVYIIFGCSIGDSDRCYFEKLFEPTKKGKHYIIYGKDSCALNSLKTTISQYVGSLSGFQSNNIMHFVDCSSTVPDALQQTKSIIDKL